MQFHEWLLARKTNSYKLVCFAYILHFLHLGSTLTMIKVDLHRKTNLSEQVL